MAVNIKNEGPLAALAALKARQTSIIPASVKPKGSDSSSTTVPFDFYSNTPTTTTTTVPTPTTTTIPADIIKGKYTQSTAPLSVQLDVDISDSVTRLQRAGYTAFQIRDVQKTGKETKKKGKFDIIGKVVGFGLDAVILKPLESLTYPRRAITSLVKETTQGALTAFKDEPAQRYKATDYIPIHPQTGLPIAKIGDLFITNSGKIVNTAIPKIQTFTTIEQAKTAQDKMVKDMQLTETGSYSEFFKQFNDPNMGVGTVIGNATNSVAANRAIGFFGDTLLDPLTWTTLGSGTAVKAALVPLTKAITREAVISLADDAAITIVKIGARKASNKLAIDIAEKLGVSVAAKEVQIASRALAVEAAQLALEQATTAAAKTAAQKTVTNAISRYSATSTRRTIGAATKQATASTLQSIKDDALQEAIEFAGTARGRVAENLAKAITDEVVSNVATRGYWGLTPILEELGIKGGFRIGVPGARISIKGSERLTGPIGRGTSALRQTAYRIPFPVAAGGMLGGIVTGRGGKGALEAGAEFDLKVGLNSGSMSTEKAVNAVRTLAEDKAFQKLAASTKAPIKALAIGLADEAYKPYVKTVMDIIDNPPVAGETASQVSTRIGRAAGKEVTDKELEFANKVLRVLGEFKDTVDNLRLTGSPGRTPVKISDTPTKWFPQTLTDKSARWLGSKSLEAKNTLVAFGLDTPPLPGQYVANELKVGSKWFSKILDGTETITQLNQIARASGLNFDFFDTNVITALTKYGDKFSKDYAFLRFIDEFSEGTKGTSRPSFLSEVSAGGGTRTAAETAALADKLSAVLPEWATTDILAARQELVLLAGKTGKSKLATDTRIEIEAALQEVDKIFEVMLRAALKDKSVANAWYSIGFDLTNNYANLFARSPKQVEEFITKLDPRILKTMVNVAEDAYISLNKSISPNTLVRADIAEMYTNILRLKDAKEANAFINFAQGLNKFTKTHYLAVPGYHHRNAFSDGFQMLVAGGRPRYLNEGRAILGKWDDFVVDYGKALDETDVLPELGDMINTFFAKYKIPTNLQYPTRAVLESEGLYGVGITRETLGGTVKGTTGILGKEIPVREGFIGTAQSKLSRAGGIWPEFMNRYGGDWEQTRRAMLTFDGIRQGLSIEESVARTSKFLVDYSDLNQLDTGIGLIIPFWTWTSRNLPAQIQNMFYNPASYALYNNFRKNFTEEDKDGRNFLMPSWMDKSGAFVTAIAGGYPIVAKPDLGFPGAGAPSPIAEGVTGGLSGVASAVSPFLRAPAEAFLAGRTTSGRKLEGTQEKLGYLAGQYLPPLSPLGRALNIPVQGGRALGIPSEGKDIPGISAIPGVKKQGETPANIAFINALIAFLIGNVSILTPDQQNSKLFEIKDAIDRMVKARKDK